MASSPGPGPAATLLGADLGARPFDVVVSFDVRAFWTPPGPEWDVVAGVLGPGGRVLVGYSVMRPGAEHGIAAVAERLASSRGLRGTGRHRGATAPFASAAVELRPAAELTREG